MSKQNRRKFISTSALAALSVPLLGMKEVLTDETNKVFSAIKPPSLKTGDTIAITSPAGAVWDYSQVEKYKSMLENSGFQVMLGKTLTEKHGYFAGTDELRAMELNELFSNNYVNGIFCMKGGWGCARILDKLHYDTIKKNPKVIMGFSDITSLLIAINAKTGLVTYHGPVGNSGWNDFTVKYVKSVLVDKSIVSYGYPEDDSDKFYTINEGKSKGILVGGNLTVLAGMIGSDYLPDWKNKILFLEETGEEPYRIDRMLTQLKLAGVLNNISGFIFGKCVKCDAEEPEKAFTIKQVLEQHVKPLGIPSFYGAMIGHIANKYTLPIGVSAEIDALTGSIKLLETAVL